MTCPTTRDARPRFLPALGAVAALVFGASSLQALAAQDASDPELFLLRTVVHKAVKKVRKSVVTIETFGGFRKVLANKAPAGGPRKLPQPKKKGKKKKKGLGPIVMPGFIQAQGASTGIVIASDGWILTSSFALNWNPSTVLVTLDDGRRFTAKVAGRDETRGIALLRVEAEDLPVADFAPLEEVEVGQWSFAVARSLAGKGPTVHVGTVSALRRISGKAIQCDTNTSPANYGAPLVDARGRILGIIAPLSPRGEAAGVSWYDSGIGFAATLQDIPDILEGMKSGRVYRRGVLGISKLDPKHLGPGARVLSVAKNTAAKDSGMRKNDMVLSVDGVDVRNSLHLQDELGSRMAGEWVELRYRRKRDSVVVEVLVELAAQADLTKAAAARKAAAK